jgi:glycosyltransferase 2 family protein
MPLILLLSLVNYAIRFGKWSYYLRIGSLSVPTYDSLLIFLSSLSMTVTPGKVGELLKAQLVKHVSGISRARTGPIVIAERLTDLLAIILLAIAGMTAFNLDVRILALVTLLPLGLLFTIACRPFALFCIGLAERLPVLGEKSDKIRDAYASIQQLVSPVPLVLMTLVSILSWGCECLGMYLAVLGFDYGISVLGATAAYAFGTVAGIVTPGGIGPADVSIPLILSSQMGEGSRPAALAATFIIRLATLWFAVGVGVVALLVFARKYGAGVERQLGTLMDQGETDDDATSDKTD